MPDTSLRKLRSVQRNRWRGFTLALVIAGLASPSVARPMSLEELLRLPLCELLLLEITPRPQPSSGAPAPMPRADAGEASL
jgi:hypothetical protein